MTAYFPFWQKLAAVMRRVWPSTSFHRATFLSGIFQRRNFPSREPLKKYLSSWKEEAKFTINTARGSDGREASLNSPWDGTQWLWQNQCAESSTGTPSWICATIGQFYPWTRTAGRSSSLTNELSVKWAMGVTTTKRTGRVHYLGPGQVQKVCCVTFVLAEWDLSKRSVPIFRFWILGGTTCLETQN